MSRFRVNRRKSARSFNRGNGRRRRENFMIMRGGWRL